MKTLACLLTISWAQYLSSTQPISQSRNPVLVTDKAKYQGAVL